MKKIVVARFTNSGFGDHLSCVLGAWLYAKQTNRDLIIDWRGSRFNPTPGKNCFFNFFAKIPALAGIQIRADDNLDWVFNSQKLYPNKWNQENLQGIGHVPHTAQEVREVQALISSGQDRDEDAVILNQHIKLPDARDLLRSCLSDLQFHTRFQKKVDLFLQEHTKGNPPVGVHLRHGNGENIGARAAYWLGPIVFARQCLRDRSNSIHVAGHDKKARGRFADNTQESLTSKPQRSIVEEKLYRNIRNIVQKNYRSPDDRQTPILLFTDAQRVVNGMSEVIPNLITYPKRVFEEGAGPLHQISGSEDTINGATVVESSILEDMLTELELLRRCRGLVCIPSQFTLVSRIELDPSCIVLLKPPAINRLVRKILV